MMNEGGKRTTPVERVRDPRTGRPDATGSQTLDRVILETAERLFVAQGYSATSMEQIAAAVGSGKQTVYRRYPSKQDLFKAIVAAMLDKLVGKVARSDNTGESPLAVLRQACRDLLDFVCEPEVIAFYRVLIAESQRFPELACDTIQLGRDNHEALIEKLLEAARAAGEISAAGPTGALRMALSGLITGWVLQEALLGQNGLADTAQRAAYFDIAWGIFLQGVEVGREGQTT